VLLNAEPEFDTADPAQALAALNQAEMVVVMSPFKHGVDYADVLLPIAPFTETSGTFVNAEGRAELQRRRARAGRNAPGWKVLRVLGNLLGLPGFDYETAEEVRAPRWRAGVASRLSNRTSVAPARVAASAANGGFERIADVPIYTPTHSCAAPVAAPDGRREGREHRRPAGRAVRQAGLEGRRRGARASRRACSAVAGRARRESVRVSAATPAGAALGSLFGELVVEKA
jgi:NADH-quinone oxidoreductase subunit G